MLLLPEETAVQVTRLALSNGQVQYDKSGKPLSVFHLNTFYLQIHLIKAPLLIIHGVDDEMVPIEHGQALHQRSGTTISPLWVPDVGHNNLENSELLWKRVRAFVCK